MSLSELQAWRGRGSSNLHVCQCLRAANAPSFLLEQCAESGAESGGRLAATGRNRVDLLVDDDALTVSAHGHRHRRLEWMREKTFPLLTLQVKSICDHVGVWMNTCKGPTNICRPGGST